MRIRRLSPLGPRTRSILSATLVGVLVTAIVGSAASGSRGRVDRSAPSAPGDIVVDSATKSSVELHWTPSRDNVGVVGYDVYLGTSRDGVYRTSRVGVTVEPRTVITRLVCGTSYAVAVNAFDVAGNRSRGTAAVVASTECVDTDPPTAPSGIRQLANTETTATITWDGSMDDNVVAGYRLFLGPAAVGTTQTIWFTFANLPCGSTLEAGIEAYDVAGNTSVRSRFYIATQPCQDSTPPTPPADLRQTEATASTVAINWTASSDDVGVEGYEVSIDGIVVDTTAGTSFRVSNLTCSRSYTVAVVAVDTAGNRSAPALLRVKTSACSEPPPGDTVPPSSPTGLGVNAVSQTSVQVVWQPSTDNVGVSGYGVYRSGAQLGTTSTTGYTFSGLTCGTSYQLGVDAFDAAGNRSSVAQVVAATAACSQPPPPPPPPPGGDTTPPSVPANVVQLNRTETSITILWAASTDDVGVAGYRLFRGGTSVGTTSQTSYTFTGLQCGSTYTLGVHAYDAAGNHSAQAVVMMTTAACPDVTPPPAPTGLAASNVTQTSATLAWNASAGAAGYGIFVNGANAGSTAQTSYTLNSLTCGTAYTLSVDAYDVAANRSARTSVSVTTAACSSPPPPPPPPGGSGNVSLATGGNDSTCVRNDQAKPCRTFDRAYQVAQPGDTVSVAGGTYPTTEPAAGATTIFPDGSATGDAPVTFTCSGEVTFDAPNFTFYPGVNDVTVKGGCFRFHVVHFGYGSGAAERTVSITVEGVHMESFEIAGADQITIRNSEIGPAVYCFGAGEAVPEVWKCRSSEPAEAYWAAKGGSTNQQMQPFIHDSKYAGPSNILLEGNWIHDHQTRESNKLHTSGMLVWNGQNLTFRRNRFERNATNDIQFSGTPTNVLMENNWFGAPYTTMDGGATPVEADKDWREVTLKTEPGYSYANWLIRFNSFAHGLSIDNSASNPTYANFRVVGNILGSYSYCESRGEKFDFNVFVGGGACGANVIALGSFPYSSYSSPIDFHLTGGSAVDFVKTIDDDAQLLSDIDGDGRPNGPGRDAGADER